MNNLVIFGFNFFWVIPFTCISTNKSKPIYMNFVSIRENKYLNWSLRFDSLTPTRVQQSYLVFLFKSDQILFVFQSFMSDDLKRGCFFSRRHFTHSRTAITGKEGKNPLRLCVRSVESEFKDLCQQAISL